MIRQLTLAEAAAHIQNDPVRPHLSCEFRTAHNREVWGLFEDQYAEQHDPRTEPLAVICVAYTDTIPQDEQQLAQYSTDSQANTAVFYTVWSYERGSGTTIVNHLAADIQRTRPEITQWVTLSPLTEMAERFHTRNGAVLKQRYKTCQVFDYTEQMQGVTA